MHFDRRLLVEFCGGVMEMIRLMIVVGFAVCLNVQLKMVCTLGTYRCLSRLLMSIFRHISRHMRVVE